MNTFSYTLGLISLSMLAFADSASKQAQMPTAELRQTLVKCAKGLGMQQPSGDIAMASLNPTTGEKSVFLFHDKGVYIFPLTKEDLNGGSIQFHARLVGENAREQGLMVTGSYEKEDLSDISFLVRNVDSADLKNEKKTSKPWVGERHYLEHTLLPWMTEPGQVQGIQDRVKFLTEYFPMASLKDDPKFKADRDKAAVTTRTDRKKGNEDYMVALIGALSRAATPAAASRNAKLAEAVEDLKACQELDPTLLRMVAREMSNVVDDAQKAGSAVSQNLKDTLGDNILEKVFSKANKYEKLEDLEKGAEISARTLFMDKVNEARKGYAAQRSSSGHAEKPVSAGSH